MNQNDGEHSTELDLTHFLVADNNETNEDKCVALIILNCPISGYEYFKRLYDQAAYTVCADGGANRLFELLEGQFSGESLAAALVSTRPNSIHGDLDSLRDEVRQQYDSIGVEISHNPDQYSTDFGKAVSKVVEKLPGARDVLILGSIGGRIDQGVGLLHELYREQNFKHTNLRFWLFSETSISTLLQPGTSLLHAPPNNNLITRNVGILPLYGKAILTLKGFEWDVENWTSEMGGQLSTSNHIMAESLLVTTDVTVLFTVERQI